MEFLFFALIVLIFVVVCVMEHRFRMEKLKFDEKLLKMRHEFYEFYDKKDDT